MQSRKKTQVWTTSPSEDVSRRVFLSGMAAVTGVAAVTGCGRPGLPRRSTRRRNSAELSENSDRHQAAIANESATGGIPGPFPGRVVEVSHSGSVREGRRDRTAIKIMVERGMRELVPTAENYVESWRFFFHRGDRVGIKVVPVGMKPLPGVKKTVSGRQVDLGRPGSISSYEVVLEVIDGLVAVGVRPADILVFDRYRDDFIRAGYADIIPEGIHWECCSVCYDDAQLEIDGQIRGQVREKKVAGYDRDVFREMAFCQPAEVHDPEDDRRFRSHLTKIVTQKVDKVISIPVLKDHRSAGVTLALKNMSHGLVNNVARSHMLIYPGSQSRGATLNQCQTFIPAAVALPPTREKCVLQILDGLVGTYEGGPGTFTGTFTTWEYKSLFFATDPVALDRVGWQIIDAQRVEQGWPSVVQVGVDAKNGQLPGSQNQPGKKLMETFHIRSPQHVPLAATLGLGCFNSSDIDHRRFQLG